MPKKKHEITPAVQAAFDAAMERIKAVTGARTQVQLAEVLDVRQSSISDAKRRCSVPDTWLVKLLRTHKVLPDWIITGEGPQYLTGTNHEAFARLQARIRIIQEDFVRLLTRVEDSLDLLSLTDAELARRKTLHAGRLAEDLSTIKSIHTELTGMGADVAAQAAAH